jgi:hypothetical protein
MIKDPSCPTLALPNVSVAGLVHGSRRVGIIPRTTPALLRACLSVGRSDSVAARRAPPSAAGSIRRRHLAHQSGCGRQLGYICRTLGAGAAPATWPRRVLFQSRVMDRRRHRDWRQLAAQARTRKLLWETHRLDLCSTKATARACLGAAGREPQFEGVVKRLGAQTMPAAPALPMRPLHGPRAWAKFVGSGRCLGRRSVRGRRRCGAKRDTARRPLAAA